MPTIPNDPFPASDFDDWAETYDQSLLEPVEFPFDGYDRVLQTILRRAAPQPGQPVLDLGTGTGNLALLFAAKGCRLTCADFSEAMLAKARQKLPGAAFLLHDLREKLPQTLTQPFAHIVSAYVFHHFDLDQKIRICADLVRNHLVPGGSLLIGDISFPSQAAQDTFRQGIPDWEDEFYWLADQALAGLEKAGLTAAHLRVSPCAGVYILQAP